MFNSIEEAIGEIENGKMIVVVDDEDRENEGDLIMSAEFITPEAVNFMAKEGRGLICAPVDEDIADRLRFYPMVQNNKESNKCNFTVSVDYNIGTTTGISASDRSKTIKAITDYHTLASDFSRPGHIFPLRSKKGGVLVRAGHTEAAVDLVKMAKLTPAAVICEIANEDGEMMRRDDLRIFAKKHNLKIISIKDLIEYRRRSEKLIKLVAQTSLPTNYGDFEMMIYKTTIDEKEHVVLKKGEFDSEDEVLVRVQSECLTGEVFLSKKCDCRLQLDMALEKMAKEGKGVLLYMRQEGRGIGLTNKIKAYSLQEKGLDTVDANKQLGFAPDLRKYGIGAQILVDIGLKNIKLMTNNPTKIIGLDGYGLNIVKRIALELPPTDRNHSYLKSKKERMGHILDMV